MPLLPGMGPLTAAANALKSAGTGASLIKQIDTVSNALVGSKRTRLVATEQRVVGFPSEARSVLDILKLQVGNSLKLLFEAEADESTYSKFIDNIEIIQGFAERVVGYYKPQAAEWSAEDEEFANFIFSTLSKAKAEAVTTLALQKLEDKLNQLRTKYENNPKMSKVEFAAALKDLSAGVRNWEDDLIPRDPFIKDSKEIRRRLSKVRAKLKEVYEIAELKDHPGNLGEEALSLLRVAASMMQEAKSRFEVQQSVEMAKEAFGKLSKSSEDFQERGRAYLLLIQQSVALFVGKQLRQIEKELEIPLYYIPGNIAEIEKTTEQLKNQMDRLITYDQFAKIWSGPHQEDLMERIALLFEQVWERAEKARELILDDTSNNKTSFDQIEDLVLIAGKLFEMNLLGSDQIHPSDVFHEPHDIAHQVETLLNKVPDPMAQAKSSISFDRLGRCYHQAEVLQEFKELAPELKQKLTILINRIEYHILKMEKQFDIFKEWKLREIYDSEVLRCEINRFFKRMGLQLQATAPERFKDYQDPGTFPFKGSDLVEIMRTHRILGHLFQGRFGKTENYPLLDQVAHDIFEERVSHATKAKLELIQRLTLSFLHPLTISEIDKIIESRIHSLPQELRSKAMDPEQRLTLLLKDQSEYQDKLAVIDRTQELWAMGAYLKATYELQRPYKERILEVCREHLRIAGSILSSSVKTNPELIRKLYLSSLQDVISESEHISFSVPHSNIAEAVQNDQFFQDHKIPETLPLYVAGDTLKEGLEEPKERLLSLTRSESPLYHWIEATATKVLFDYPLEKIQGIREIFNGPEGINGILPVLEEKSLYLEIASEKDEARITGYAQLLLKDSLAPESQDFRSVTMRVVASFSQSKTSDLSITFINKPYHVCLSAVREAKKWNLF